MNRNPLDKFEQGIQDAYNNYELPYSSSEFSQVSRRLFRKRLFSGLALWGGIAAVTTIVGISGYLVISSKSNTPVSAVPNGTEISNTVFLNLYKELTVTNVVKILLRAKQLYKARASASKIL